jgi:hypothetical protein
LTNKTVINIRTEIVIDMPSNPSSINVGTGTKSTINMPIMPKANIISVCFIRRWIPNENDIVIGGAVAIVSAIILP